MSEIPVKLVRHGRGFDTGYCPLCPEPIVFFCAECRLAEFNTKEQPSRMLGTVTGGVFGNYLKLFSCQVLLLQMLTSIFGLT
jgi:hypothetical protein